MPLFETIPIDKEEVAKLVKEHWGLTLGDCVKASQNHTFLAQKDDKRFVVRVTPDPNNKRNESTKLELEMLRYLSSHDLPVCGGVVSNITGREFVREGSLIISVFNFAVGEPVVYPDWLWMTEEDYVKGIGRWMAKFHALSRKFTEDHQDLVKSSARQWTELHDGLLKDVPVDPKDEETRSDPKKYGLIHGDINPSNYYWMKDVGLPSVFDWDQLQLSWFLYDLSCPIFAVEMLEEAGSPIDFKPVAQANSKQFTSWLIEGYEKEGGVVDREELKRMLFIRRQLYKLFCTKALDEIELDSFIGKFCKFVSDWLKDCK